MNENDKAVFKDWQKRHLPEEAIRDELKQMGVTAEEAETLLKQYFKKQVEARLTIGFVLMITGAFIGFLSCVFTIADPVPEWRNFFLYGLTSISVVVALAGCYLVFERP